MHEDDVLDSSCDDKDDITEIRVVAEVHEQCEENHVD